MTKPLTLHDVPARLRGADLPLLIALDVLLQECNVTRAAARLHVSQPALSAKLSRLRVLFDDPLLVPAENGRGLAPSPFALKLHRRLQPALGALTAAIRPAIEDFDPDTAARTFNIVANNTAAAAVIPAFSARLQALGNRQLRLTVAEPDDARLGGMLERGEVDLCLSAACMLPPGLSTSQLVASPYVLIQRQGHPRGAGPVSLDDYCSLVHVNVARDSSLHGFLDEQLYRLGRTRSVAIAVRDFSAVGAIVAGSDLVCTVPAFLAPAPEAGVEVRALAFPLQAYLLCMAWHPGAEDEPGLRWLRGQLLAAMGVAGD